MGSFAAISVLSAIEGLSIATPMFNQWLQPLSIGILAGLFLVQRHRHQARSVSYWSLDAHVVFIHWWFLDYGVFRKRHLC